jgi:hypothetical protein
MPKRALNHACELALVNLPSLRTMKEEDINSHASTPARSKIAPSVGSANPVSGELILLRMVLIASFW